MPCDFRTSKHSDLSELPGLHPPDSFGFVQVEIYLHEQVGWWVAKYFHTSKP